MMPPAAAPIAMPAIAPLEREEFDEVDEEEPAWVPSELPVGTLTPGIDKESEPMAVLLVSVPVVLEPVTALLESEASAVVCDVSADVVGESVASVEYSPLLKLRQKSAASEKTAVYGSQWSAPSEKLANGRYAPAPFAYPHRWYTQLSAPASM